VIQDIKTLGVKNLRNLAMEKDSWLLRNARATYSCKANDEDES
jgi:hypothetical protein